MADESIQIAPAISARPALNTTLAALKPPVILAAGVVLVVPLAIDPFGLRAFLPVKQAVLLVGMALVALSTAVGFAWMAWHARPPADRCALRELPHAGKASSTSCANPAHPRQHADSRLGLWAMGTALALWSWSLVVVTPRALNPALHLGFGWACLSAHLVIFFMAVLCARAARNTRSRQSLELLLGAVAVAALAMACHAYLQAANADPLAWIVGRPVQESGRWRLFTTTGNPDWTAEYLAAAAPVAVWWASRFTRGAALLWLLFAAAILPTGSRLGLAGLLAGAAIDTWARRRGRPEVRMPRRSMHVVLASLVVVGSLAYFLFGYGDAETLQRWGDFHSVFARLRLWQASLHLIAARPFGYGLDHFALALPDGLRAVAAPLDPVARSRLPDLLTAHAHNDFLEMGVEAGVPGGLLLLALFVLGAYAAWRAPDPLRPSAANQSSGDAQASARALASAGPALAASLGVLFMLAVASAPLHTPATALLFWVVLGCLAGSTPARALDAARARGHRRDWQRVASLVAICAALPTAGWAGNLALTLLNENRQAAAAATMAAAGQTHAAELRYEPALARAPWDHESGVALASLLVNDHRPDEALDVLDRADGWSQSREGWLVRAHALLLLHDTDAALQVLERATAAMPDFLRAEMSQARLAANMGRKAEAKAAWHQVLLSPQRSARARQLKFEAAQAWARHAMYAADPVMAHQTATSQAGK